jgi:hypothetical protein
LSSPRGPAQPGASAAPELDGAGREAHHEVRYPVAVHVLIRREGAILVLADRGTREDAGYYTTSVAEAAQVMEDQLTNGR